LAARREFEVTFLGEASPDRPYDAEFLGLVRERRWCAYAGFADREKLKRELRGATLLVLPSLEDNCPMVVLEAMAAGRPVLAAKVGGLPDLIEEGKTGFFCDPLDAASMRGAVEKVLGDRSGAAAVAEQARWQARERFHPHVIARRHVKIYREVLSKDS